MRVIRTNFNEESTLEGYRVYETNFDDLHFDEVISTHRECLEQEIIEPDLLYVYTDDNYVEDITKYYASVSFKKRNRGADTIYEVCVITIENYINEETIKSFLKIVLEKVNMDYDSVRISFTHDIDAITYSLVSDNHITECVNIIYKRYLAN